jgi:hypothetical protein
MSSGRSPAATTFTAAWSARPSPNPPGHRRATGNPAGTCYRPIQDFLDKLADQPLTVWEIWTTVTDQHDSDASYAAARDYIRSHRQRK